MSRQSKRCKRSLPLDYDVAMEMLRKNIAGDYAEHPDRGLVLLCGAIVEQQLEKLLRLKFQDIAPELATDDELDFWFVNDPLPPFGSAGLKVRFACLMKLIKQGMKTAFSGFFSLRNRFAHEPIPPDLSKEIIVLRGQLPQEFQDICKMLENKLEKSESPMPYRTVFWLFVTILMMELRINNFSLTVCKECVRKRSASCSLRVDTLLGEPPAAT